MASLQELPDDELDKLFRSSAEEFEPPYNPEDWNSLRRRLDDDDRSRFFDRFIYWGLPLLLLLLTTVSLLVQSYEGKSAAQKIVKPLPGFSTESRGSAPDDPTTARRNESSNDANKAAPADESIVAALPSSKNRVSEKPGFGKTASGSSVRFPVEATRAAKPADHPVNQASKNSDEVASTGVTAKNRLLPVEAKNRRSARAFTEQPGSRNRANREPIETNAFVRNWESTKNRGIWQKPGAGIASKTGQVPDASSTPLEPTTPEPNPEIQPVDLTENLSPIASRQPTSPPLPRLPELDLEPLFPPVIPKMAAAAAVPVIGYPALSVRLVAAPDLNFVGKSREAARGLSVGFLVEYRFLKRFTVQSGVLRSVKKYTAPASEYTLPDTIKKHWYGPWYESVGAACTILDIPLNLRYDVFVNDRRRWFVNAGASSYIMQKETYEYYYPIGTKPTSSNQKYKGWNGSTGFHALSHLNFSLGYERNFSSNGFLRRLSWQVEPFLKYARGATLGYGKIRLTSTGVFFSLRYRL